MPANVEYGHAGVDTFRICVTEKSVRTIHELKNYTWLFDEKTGKFINEPAKGQDDHVMDAFRYWVMGEIMGKVKQEKTNYEAIFGTLC